MKPQAADIVAIQGATIYGRLIRLVTGGPVSHVGLVVADDPPLVIEALSRVVTRPIEQTLEASESAYLLRPINIGNERRHMIVRAACLHSAARYGYAKIALHLVDSIFGTQFFSRAFSRKKYPICSFHVAQAYASAGLHFGEPAAGVTPAEILRFAVQNPDKFAIERLF